MSIFVEGVLEFVLVKKGQGYLNILKVFVWMLEGKYFFKNMKGNI